MIIECVLTDTDPVKLFPLGNNFFGAVKISDELVSCVFVQLGPGPNQNTILPVRATTHHQKLLVKFFWAK